MDVGTENSNLSSICEHLQKLDVAASLDDDFNLSFLRQVIMHRRNVARLLLSSPSPKERPTLEEAFEHSNGIIRKGLGI